MDKKPVSIENRQSNPKLGKKLDTKKTRAEISRPNPKQVTKTGVSFRTEILEK